MVTHYIYKIEVPLIKAYRNPGITLKVGELLRLAIPYEGRPMPKITWKKIEPPKKGWEFLEAELKDIGDRAALSKTQFEAVLAIRDCQMDDSGSYTINVKVGDMEVAMEW